MRVRLLEDVPGIGLLNEQVGLNDSKALELITAHKAIDVDSCVVGAKEGKVANEIWAQQEAAGPTVETQAEGDTVENSEKSKKATKAPPDAQKD